jgi:imidazolonepropionase-like amidohydrolase
MNEEGENMRIDIVNGSVVPGDGESFLEDTSVITQDGLITDLPRMRHIPYNFYSHRVIDAQGGIIMPGLINIHTHCISFGPILTYAHRPIPEQRVLANLDRHLLQGETTLLNGDGFVLPHEIEATNKVHPSNIRMSTLHTPKSIRAAEIIIGRRLDEWHRRFTAEEAVALGALALGEVGCPATTCGTYEKRLKLGRDISAPEARRLDNAVLADDDVALRQALDEIGLEEMTVEEGRRLVEETSFLPIEAANDMIEEAVIYVKKLGVPTLVHAEPGSREVLLEAAKELGPKLIAVHVNHTFSVDESLKLAKELKRLGAFVEIITADPFGAKQVEESPENAFALLKEGLVDLITTDYSGGYHDAILLVLQKAIEEGIISLPRAVQLATSTPTRAVPRVAPNRGLVEPGKVADLCIVDRNDISKVRYVIIGGRVVVEDGRLVQTYRHI